MRDGGKAKKGEVPGASDIISITPVASMEFSDSLIEDAQLVFRRHFEAHFKPLPDAKKSLKVVEDIVEPEYEDDTDWEGISEPGESGQIEVIQHTAVTRPIMAKEVLKAFMTSKPPTSGLESTISPKSTTISAEDSRAEAANLKNDLALQRLIAESDLLKSSNSPVLSGTNRHKATDLRLQTLGAKESILKQESMPRSHRLGIIAKKTEREDKRRKEARENGIILEKAGLGTKRKNEGKRDRGIGGPAVGKFSGGTLRLSKKDIFNIEGTMKTLDKKGGRRASAKGRVAKRSSY